MLLNAKTSFVNFKNINKDIYHNNLSVLLPLC